MALKILLVFFVSCGVCLPAMADSIPTVSATYLNATWTPTDYTYSGGGAGNVSFGGSAIIGFYNFYPDGEPLGYVDLFLSGTHIFDGARLSTSVEGDFGSAYVYYYGGVTITSPDVNTALIIPGTYTFPAVAKGSFIACSHPYDACQDGGPLPPDAIVGNLVVNLQGIATLQVTSLGENSDNPYGSPVDYYTISFAGASTPTPEPISYGFVLIGGALLAFLGTRARRRPDCSAPAIRFSSNGQHGSP